MWRLPSSRFSVRTKFKLNLLHVIIIIASVVNRKFEKSINIVWHAHILCVHICRRPQSLIISHLLINTIFHDISARRISVFINRLSLKQDSFQCIIYYSIYECYRNNVPSCTGACLEFFFFCISIFLFQHYFPVI